jgi:hypothetical protein
MERLTEMYSLERSGPSNVRNGAWNSTGFEANIIEFNILLGFLWVLAHVRE